MQERIVLDSDVVANSMSSRAFGATRKKLSFCFYCVNNKNKRTTSRIPTWSPTVVLTGPGNAWLRWADGKRYSHCCMVVPANTNHLQYANSSYIYKHIYISMHTYAYTSWTLMLCCRILPIYMIYIHRHQHTRRNYLCYRAIVTICNVATSAKICE